jgi:hypothetical protein
MLPPRSTRRRLDSERTRHRPWGRTHWQDMVRSPAGSSPPLAPLQPFLHSRSRAKSRARLSEKDSVFSRPPGVTVHVFAMVPRSQTPGTSASALAGGSRRLGSLETHSAAHSYFLRQGAFKQGRALDETGQRAWNAFEPDSALNVPASKDLDVVSAFVATDGMSKFDYRGRVLPDATLLLLRTSTSTKQN